MPRPIRATACHLSSNVDIYQRVIRLSSSERRRLARTAGALSDETRLRILERLSAGERCVCELTGALGSAQSRLSFHLKVLREAGLVTARREGRWMYYALDPEALADHRALVRRLAAPSPASLPVLEQRLGRTKRRSGRAINSC